MPTASNRNRAAVILCTVLLGSLCLASIATLTAFCVPGTGLTTRVSVGVLGTEANERSHYPSVSADGRYVAFSSKASNLVGHLS